MEKRLENLIDYIVQLQFENFNKMSAVRKTSEDVGGWPFIQSGMKAKQITNILNTFGKTKNSKILDAGCGFSPILIKLAYEGYRNLYGVDINERYLSSLKRFFEENFLEDKIKMFKDNLLKLDYSEFDVIYSYMPLKEEKYGKYIERVFETMKRGAIFIELVSFSERYFKKYIKNRVSFELHKNITCCKNTTCKNPTLDFCYACTIVGKKYRNERTL